MADAEPEGLRAYAREVIALVRRYGRAEDLAVLGWIADRQGCPPDIRYECDGLVREHKNHAPAEARRYQMGGTTDER